MIEIQELIKVRNNTVNLEKIKDYLFEYHVYFLTSSDISYLLYRFDKEYSKELEGLADYIDNPRVTQEFPSDGTFIVKFELKREFNYKIKENLIYGNNL